MKTKSIVLAITAALVAVSTPQIFAEDATASTPAAPAALATEAKPEKAKAKGEKFSGSITAIDKAAGTLTVKDGAGAEKVLSTTGETKYRRGESKAAKLEEYAVGEEVNGKYEDKAGKLEVLALRFGPKPVKKAE